MKITYLGTGASEGFPGLFCQCGACARARKLGGKNIKTRCCALINDKVLLDISPDIYWQSLRENIDLSKIRHLIMTHSHGDHLNTFAISLRLRDMASVCLKPQERTFYIYGNETVHLVIKEELSRIPNANGERMHYQEIHAFDSIQVDSLKITALKADHKKDEECLIYAIQDERGSFLYANDTGAVPLETLEFLKKSQFCFDVVSMDSARGTLPGDGHMGFQENLEFRRQLEDMGAVHKNTRYFLNHFSHMCGLTPEEYQQIIKKDGFVLAYDGMKLEI